MGLGIKTFHAFIKGDFRKQIRCSYEKYEICSEADLQAMASTLISDFFKNIGPAGKSFRVLNKPFFKDVGIHPDIAVFKAAKPWVLLELKERRRMTKKSADREWRRLVEARNRLRRRPKRGYLVYVSRKGDERVLSGPKGAGARFFFEIPIVLEEYWTKEQIAEFEEEFKKRSKIIVSKLADGRR